MVSTGSIDLDVSVVRDAADAAKTALQAQRAWAHQREGEWRTQNATMQRRLEQSEVLKYEIFEALTFVLFCSFLPIFALC